MSSVNSTMLAGQQFYSELTHSNPSHKNSDAHHALTLVATVRKATKGGSLLTAASKASRHFPEELAEIF